MRTRIQKKAISLCSRTSPDGNSQMGLQEIERKQLKQKFDDCTITKDELRRYASLIAISGNKDPKQITVTILGVTKRVTMEEYEKYYKPCGYKPCGL